LPNLRKGAVKPLGIVGLVGLFTLPASCAVHHDPSFAIEVVAITSLQAIAKAQTSYRTVCGNGGYAATLNVLLTPPAGSGEGFLDASLGASQTPEKSRYKFTMTAGAGAVDGPVDCNGTKTVTGFYATAVPMVPDASAQRPTRAFAINQSGLVWQRFGAIAPTEPFGPPAYPIQ
jgi:hypothetical protein